MCDGLDEVSCKPMSLCKGSNVIYLKNSSQFCCELYVFSQTFLKFLKNSTMHQFRALIHNMYFRLFCFEIDEVELKESPLAFKHIRNWSVFSELTVIHSKFCYNAAVRSEKKNG